MIYVTMILSIRIDVKYGELKILTYHACHSTLTSNVTPVLNLCRFQFVLVVLWFIQNLENTIKSYSGVQNQDYNINDIFIKL